MSGRGKRNHKHNILEDEVFTTLLGVYLELILTEKKLPMDVSFS